MEAATIDDHLGSNLPPEIVTDILSRLPVKSLCRFKCVSPSWKTLISSPHFAQTHLNRTKANNHPPYKAILSFGSHDLFSLDFADATPTPKKLDSPDYMFDCFSPLSSCNGLVLLSDEGYVNFLFNPSTSEYKELPPHFLVSSSEGVFTVLFPPGLGYDSYTDDYKVVMPFCFEPNPLDIMNVAVYSLKNDAWRIIQDFHYTLVKSRRGVCRCGVCFNERLHWLCWRTGGSDDSKFVVTFNLADEIFGEVQLPALYDDHESMSHEMVVLGGCLCLLVWLNGDRIDIWMMMEYGVRESWTKFSIANPGNSIVDVLCLSAQDELVLKRQRLRDIRGMVEYEIDGEELILYNPKKGGWRDVVVPGIQYVVGDLLIETLVSPIVGGHYIETLVSPNHGGRISETM